MGAGPSPFLSTKEGVSVRYAIEGDNLPVAICTLQDGERMLTEKGAMRDCTCGGSLAGS